MNNCQNYLFLRWLFYSLAMGVSYLCIRGYFMWGGGIKVVPGVLAFVLYLSLGLAIEFFLRRARIVVWVVLLGSGFLTAWALLGYVGMENFGYAALALFLALIGCIVGLICTQRLGSQIRQDASNIR